MAKLKIIRLPAFLLTDAMLASVRVHARQFLSDYDEGPAPEVDDLIADVNAELARRGAPVALAISSVDNLKFRRE